MLSLECGDGGGLVRLGVAAEGDPERCCARGHLLDVGEQAAVVDDQRGRDDRLEFGLRQRWRRGSNHPGDPDARGVAKGMRPVGAKANEVAWAELVAFGLDQELDLAVEDICDLLSRVTDHVAIEPPAGLEGQQVGLDGVIVAAAEQLVEHAASPAHPRHRGGAVADDLDALRTRRGRRVSQEIGDVQSEVLSHQLQALERHPGVSVLQRRERRGRDADFAGLGSQGLARLRAQPADPLAHDAGRSAIALWVRPGSLGRSVSPYVWHRRSVTANGTAAARWRQDPDASSAEYLRQYRLSGDRIG